MQEKGLPSNHPPPDILHFGPYRTSSVYPTDIIVHFYLREFFLSLLEPLFCFCYVWLLLNFHVSLSRLQTAWLATDVSCLKYDVCFRALFEEVWQQYYSSGPNTLKYSFCGRIKVTKLLLGLLVIVQSLCFGRSQFSLKTYSGWAFFRWFDAAERVQMWLTIRDKWTEV